MTKDRNTPEFLFSGLEPPGPPEDLRRRVLQNAKEGLASAPATDGWSRLWESSFVRLAWAMSVLVLIVCHIAITPRPVVGQGSELQSAANQAPDKGDELSETVSLPEMNLNERPCEGHRYSRMLCEIETNGNEPAETYDKESES